eukprot:9188485-Lingulodinium_polyedra.AAC.1
MAPHGGLMAGSRQAHGRLMASSWRAHGGLMASSWYSRGQVTTREFHVSNTWSCTGPTQDTKVSRIKWVNAGGSREWHAQRHQH